MPYTPEEIKPLSAAERLQFGLSADAGAVSKPTPSNAPVEMPDSLAAPAAPEPDFNTRMSNYVKLVGEHYNRSDEKLAEGFSYYRAVIGLDTYEGVKAKTNQVANDARRAANMSAVESLVPPEDIGRIFLPLIDALPGIKHSMEAVALGSMTTGGTAALAGGALSGPVGAGVAGGVGIVFGGPAAAFTFTATQSAGAKYKEFRDAGISHADASRYALAHGTAQGAIEAAQTFLVTKAATKAFGAVMKSPGGTKLMQNAVFKFLGNAGMEGAEEGSQEIADILINHMASKEFKIPTLSDKSKWGERVTQSIIAGAFIGGAFSAGAHVGGALTAKAAKLAIDGKTGTFADTVRDVLGARDAAIAEEKNALKVAAIKGEIPTTLKQAITQAEATMKVTGKISSSTVATHVNNTPAKTSLQEAQDDFDKAKTKYRAAQADHKSVSKEVSDALQTDGVVSKVLQGRLDQAIKLEDEANLDYDAAKLSLVRTKIQEQLKASGLSPEEIATLKEREDEIRVKERKVKLEVAHRSLGRQAAKLDATLHALVDEIQSRKTTKENKKAGLFKKYFGEAQPLTSTGNKKKDKKNQKNHFREDGAPKNTIPVVDQMIAMEAAAIDKTLPTKQLEDQAARVKDRRDTLRLMQELIENDLLSNAEIAELRNAIPAGRAKELVNLAISKLYSSARDIAWSTKNKIAINQKLMRDLITLSGLTEEDQTRFLKRIPQVQSPTDLRNIMDDTTVEHKPGTKAFKEHGPTSQVPGLNTLIGNLLEVRAKEDAIAKLQKTIREAEPRKSGSTVRSRFTPEGQLQFYLDTVESMINPTDAQVKAEAAKGGVGNATDRAQKANIEAALAKRDLEDPTKPETMFTTDDAIRESAAVTVGVLSESKAADVRQLNSFLKDIIKNGVKERAAKLAVESTMQDALNAKVEHGIFPKLSAEDIEAIVVAHNTSPTRTSAERVMQYLKTSDAESYSWDGILNIILQDIHPKERVAIREALDLGRHLNNEKAMFNKNLDFMHKSISEATGMSVKQVFEHSVRSTKQLISFDWVNSKGEEISTGTVPVVDAKGTRRKDRVSLDVATAQRMLLMLRDKELNRSAIEGNGFTLKGMHYVQLNPDGSVMMTGTKTVTEADGTTKEVGGEAVLGARIPDHLTTEGALELALKNSAPNDVNLKVLDGMRTYLQHLYKQLAAEYFQDTGLVLPDNPNYSGPALHSAAVDENMVDSFKAEMKARWTNKNAMTGRANSTRTRTDSALALKFEGIYGVMTSHTAQSTHWMAWRKPSRVISRALLNPRTKSLIEFKYGKGMFAAMSLHISDATIGRMERHDAWLKHYNHFLNKMSPLVLLGKLQQFPKQMTQVFTALTEMSGVDLARGIYDFHDNVDEATNTLMASDAYRNRYDGTLNTWQGAMLQQSEYKFTEDKINQFLGMGLIEGDRYVSLQVAWAKYQAELRAGTAKDLAMERAWNLVERTQSSGRQDQISNIGRSGWLKSLTVFKQQQQKASEILGTTNRDFVNGHISLYQVVRMHGILRLSQVAFAAVEVGLALIAGADDDEMEQNYLNLIQQFALGPTGALGSVWALAYVMAQNKILKELDGPKAAQSKKRDLTIPAFDFITNLGRLFSNSDLAMQDGNLSWEEFLILWGNYAKSIQRLTLTPLDKYPLEPRIKELKAISGVKGETITPPKMME